MFYDDVQYIKGGYIARNKILVADKEWVFTVPLSGASANKRIDQVLIDMSKWEIWKKKFMRTLHQVYSKADRFQQGMELVTEVLDLNDDRISELAASSVEAVFGLLGWGPEFERSSDRSLGAHLTFEDRLIYICQHEKVATYVQAPGGVDLYSGDRWRSSGVDLVFVRPVLSEYDRRSIWMPGLSMIDLLMHVAPAEIARLLGERTLFTN